MLERKKNKGYIANKESGRSFPSKFEGDGWESL